MNNERLLRLPEVMRRTGLARATIYKFIKEGFFPNFHKLGARTAVWREVEVQEWIMERIEERDSKVA